jgi:diguanylate cyclase (GGDEF)-like protein
MDTATHTRTPSPVGSGDDPKILLVDDDSRVLDSLTRSLRRDFTLMTASSAENALVLLAANRIAVLVVDMSMPKMDGLQLIEAMRENHADVVPIMLTGRLDQRTATDAINRGGVFRFLSKPCEAEQIKTAISDALMQHRLQTARRELLVKTETLEAAFAAMHDGICIVDADRKIAAVNGRAVALLDLPEQPLGTSPPDVLLEEGEPMREILFQDQLLQVSAATLSTGSRLLVVHDVTKIRQLEQKLRLDATTDPLTRIANRRRFLEFGAEEQARANRHHRPLSIVMVDVDFFKKVNDQYGHAGGDDVLRHIAGVLSDGVRTTDMAARFGGEEFIALLSETPLDEAIAITERLRLAIAGALIETAAGIISVTASFGVATAADGHVDIERLIAAADAALYVAKRNGRNRVECAAEASPTAA